MKDFLLYVVFLIIVNAFVFLAIWTATSHEDWYVGMHDSECEKTLYGEKCHCYERFVATNKKQNHK